MKIKQGYKSSSMDAFQFLEMHKLEPLHDKYEPLVVFGCYNTDDLKVILEHHSIVVIQWEGLDSKKWRDLGVFKNSSVNLIRSFVRMLCGQVACKVSRVYILYCTRMGYLSECPFLTQKDPLHTPVNL